jgi:hypothetical protein
MRADGTGRRRGFESAVFVKTFRPVYELRRAGGFRYSGLWIENLIREDWLSAQTP